MKVKIVKKGKDVDKFLKGLNSLDSHSVDIGHFASQGEHSRGLQYVELLYIWANGIAHNNEGQIQHPLAQFIFQDIQTGKFIKSPLFQSAIKDWYKGLDKASAASKFAKTVGVLGEEEYKKIFNVSSSPHMSMEDNTSPMYETGELMEATTHKVNKG